MTVENKKKVLTGTLVTKIELPKKNNKDKTKKKFEFDNNN